MNILKTVRDIPNYIEEGCHYDSFGTELQIGDYALVIYANGAWSSIMIGMVVASETSEDRYKLIDIFNYDNRGLNVYPRSYLFKITKQDVEDYKAYNKRMNAEAKKAGDRYYAWSLDDVYSGIDYREDLYKLSNNVTTIRGLKTGDIFGRTINPGDIAYFIDKDNLGCGIIVSDTHVFTTDLQKKVAHHVFIQKSLTSAELELKKKLQSYYLGSVKAVKKKGYTYGDVYTNAKYSYVYLGKIELSCLYRQDSDVLIQAVVKNDMGYWLKSCINAPINYEGTIGNTQAFMLHAKGCFSATKTENMKIRVKGNFVANYRGVSNFDCLTTILPAKAKYIGNLKLPDTDIYLSSLESWSELKDFSLRLYMNL